MQAMVAGCVDDLSLSLQFFLMNIFTHSLSCKSYMQTRCTPPTVSSMKIYAPGSHYYFLLAQRSLLVQRSFKV